MSFVLKLIVYIFFQLCHDFANCMFSELVVLLFICIRGSVSFSDQTVSEFRMSVFSCVADLSQFGFFHRTTNFALEGLMKWRNILRVLRNLRWSPSELLYISSPDITETFSPWVLLRFRTIPDSRCPPPIW